MANGDLNWIANFIWGIADDALRDLYVRGKYRDVILPMMVLRRLDAVLESGKKDVLSMKENLDEAGITNQDAALRQAAEQAFYNTSHFTKRVHTSRANEAQLNSGSYLLDNGACGTGCMLTVGEETLTDLAIQHGKQVSTQLYGQEINAETYAIAKADLLLKGEGEEADNIVGGPEWSTLAN